MRAVQAKQAHLFVSPVIDSGANFSDDRRYRTLLWRRWGAAEPNLISWINFLMLNPSIATADVNDPTVALCESNARLWGFDGLLVTNINAYVSTDPRMLKRVQDPVGPDNDAAILEAATRADAVVCAWGRWGLVNDRGNQVRDLLRSVDAIAKKMYCLRLSAGTGQPWHPLYLGHNPALIHWSGYGNHPGV